MPLNLLAVAGLLLLASAGCAGTSPDQGSAADIGGDAEPADIDRQPASAPDADSDRQPASAPDVGNRMAAEGSRTALSDGPHRDADADRDTGRQLAWHGTLHLTVDDPEHTIGALEQAAAGHDGQFVAVESRRTDQGAEAAIDVQVPAAHLQRFLADLADLGDIASRNLTATDHTGELTDLDSALRHLRASEEFLLDLFDDADSVDDALTLRRHLDDILARIEQIEGRRSMLAAQVDYATITVLLTGTDTTYGQLSDPDPQTDWRATLTDARHTLEASAAAVLLAAAAAAPALLAAVTLAAAAAVSIRHIRRRRSRRLPDPPPAPAA